MGRPTPGNDYPFVGLLAFYDAEGDYMHRCTGTLVSPTVVLTAGHCMDGAALAYAYFEVTVPTTSGEGTLMIVSVASWGDAICRSNDRTQRIDIASVLASSRSSG